MKFRVEWALGALDRVGRENCLIQFKTNEYGPQYIYLVEIHPQASVSWIDRLK